MMQTASKQRISIIGAGPVGLEAALYGKMCGYQVQVLEKADIAHHIHQWGQVTFFSPFKLNHSPLGKKILRSLGHLLPDDERFLTGTAYIENYLAPLARSDYLKSHIVRHCEVVAVSRGRLLKGELIGDGKRRDYPFKILGRNPDGQEIFYESDYLIDASGTFGNPNWMGEGGIPALGESANRHRIEYGLADIGNRNKKTYLGKTALLVGSGHSAATSLAAFKPLFQEDPATAVIWATRNAAAQPIGEIIDDPLPERARIVREANQLTGHPGVRRIRSAAIHSVAYDQNHGMFRIDVLTPEGRQAILADNLIANVGYGPDNRIYRELQVHECYASRGPMKLAAALLGETGEDCLAQSAPGADMLKNPEPDFYILGMKSYGKHPNFLLKVAFEQIREIYKLISGNAALDLYQGADPADL